MLRLCSHVKDSQWVDYSEVYIQHIMAKAISTDSSEKGNRDSNT